MQSKCAAADVDQPLIIGVFVLMATVPASVMLMAPVLLGAFVDHLHFAIDQAGYVISLEIGALAIGGLPIALLVHRLNLRMVSRVLFIFLAVGNLFSANLDSFAPFALSRFVTALAGGGLLAISVTYIGFTKRRERNYAFWIMGQLLWSAFGLIAVPIVVASHGLKPVFVILSVISLMFLPMVGRMPDHRAYGRHEFDHVIAGIGKLRALLGVLAIFLMYGGGNGVFVFLERIGIQAGINQQTAGVVLGLSALFGVAGAGIAAVLGSRFGWWRPIATGMGLYVISLWVLLGHVNIYGYSIAVSLFAATWSLLLPFFFSRITAIDSGGRLIIVANVMYWAGLTCGPATAAYIVKNSELQMVLYLAISSTLISLLCIRATFPRLDLRPNLPSYD